MALCTKCGAILHDEDNTHVCNPLDVPQKGKVKVPQTSEKLA